MVPTVFVEAESVERMLTAAMVAASPPSMMAWLAGPMTQNLQRRAQERFLGQGEDVSSGGWSPWEPLKEATIAFRAHAGYGPVPINVRTGELERYITQSNSAVTATSGGAAMVYPGTAPSGYLEEKVRTAQAGKSKPDTSPRPVLGLGAPDLEFALVSLHTWLVSSINAGGVA